MAFKMKGYSYPETSSLDQLASNKNKKSPFHKGGKGTESTQQVMATNYQQEADSESQVAQHGPEAHMGKKNMEQIKRPFHKGSQL